MKIRQPKPRQARIEMLPLIDIVFLLLVFFIYAMLSMAVQRGLHLDLPESAQAEISQESPLAVSVRGGEAGLEVYLDKELMSLDQLGKRLAALAKGEGDEPQVSLFAEKDISYQQLYNVLDRIQASGIAAISLQAEAKE